MRYEEPVFRPPSEAQSLILQVTIGCSINGCAFCGMYKTKKYRVRNFTEIEKDILEARELWPGTRKIFLADGDALALPTDDLIQILNFLNDSFPQLSRVGIYINASNVHSKTDQELEQLFERKLKIGYLGLESGHDEILSHMKKGATADQMIHAVQRCQEHGIKMSVMVLLGLGGQEKSREHARATAKALNRMNPRYLSLLSLMPVQGTSLYRKIQQGAFTELAPQEILQEMKWVIEDLDLKGTIFRSNHASNYLALAGRFPQDKGRLLSEIENCLNGKGILRDEWERGL